jgi:hypothetical protein
MSLSGRAVVAVKMVVLLTAAWLLPVSVDGAADAAAGRRVVMYYQTQYSDGAYVSPLGLTNNDTGLTDLVVAALHLNGDGSVCLNDDPLDAPRYRQMWTDLKTIQAAGVRVSVMLGGAAPGSFERLETAFATYYPRLRNVIASYHLDGVDLDVEETMSLAAIEQLITTLRADFGPHFIITLAPVASALTDGAANLSGFSYPQLERAIGSQISWYNAQFYNGFAFLDTSDDYENILFGNPIPLQKIVVLALTSQANGGSGYVEPHALATVLRSIVARHPDFGGIAGWEYFNATPGGASAPWQWTQIVGAAVRD